MTARPLPTSAPVEAEPFDVCGPLPSGTTVLEASAGTGKTYTIAALAARYVAEGRVELSELMVITFGRTATNELRMRVRERLDRTERELATRLAGGDAADDRAGGPAGVPDDVSRLLCAGSDAELRQRHRRVRAALAEFDAATIATTHEFCQTMIDELGVLGDHESDATFTDTLTDLAHEVAGDCYLARFAADQVPPPFTFAEAVRIATDVIVDETVTLVPVPTAGDRTLEPAQRYGFARDVRRQLRIRKARRRLYSYSDMLTRLQHTLHDPLAGEPARQRLRDRYRVVLVDEFQDTDPVQWDILRTAFVDHATLILIGDPKQAIYAFRGADVYSYLDAVGQADRVGTLAVNHRSDQDLITALDSVLGDVALGDPRITVRAVSARHRRRRLWLGGDGDRPDDVGDEAGAGLLAPVRLRYQPYEPGPDRPPGVDQLRPRIVQDLVCDITGLLAARPRIDIDGERELCPGDIAVLVRRNERAEEIRSALTAAGVPAVVLGANSVYAGDTAREWLALLVALEQPRQAHVRAAALTGFVGWTMSRLATADEDEMTGLSAMIRRWSRVLTHRGVAALMEAVTTDTALARRVLSVTGGERRLTDLRHIGQSLHAAMVSGRLGVAAVIDWLRQRIDEARNTASDERSRRLETDAEAVQILTVHRSKGLQFPIVYLPEAWDRYVARDDKGRTLRVHDRTRHGAAGDLVLDVGGCAGADRRERWRQYQQEEGGEDLRLAYVAFTRAQLQVVTWWMPSANTPCSALQRLLFRSAAAGNPEPAERYDLTGDPSVLALTGPHPDRPSFSVEPIGTRRPVDWRPGSQPAPRLDRRRFDRELDLAWRRTSYSALTAAAHGAEAAAAGVGSEPEPVKEDDESQVSDSLTELGIDADGRHQPGDLVSPMDGLPMGAAFGTVVHTLLEHVDPHSGDLAAALEALAGEELSRLPAQPMTAAELAAGVLPALLTPLGPLAQDRRLADIAVTDRLAELTFELPLAGGDRPRAEIRLADVAELLRGHLGPDDPLSEYPGRLSDPGLAEQPLRGYLTGSIDAVLRLDDDGRARYLVVDYKTNWLGDLDRRPLRVSAYRPAQLPEAMMRAHYPLQALLYSVALHRYLRWRQPGYRADVHLGGVLYLFVRGMAGPDTPRENGVPCGVFSWRPPARLVEDLSDLLDRGDDRR